jgi:ATP-binding cassette subfamily F protein uup
MVSYLQIEGLTKRFGADLMYENVDIEISQGQKIAIIAKNGAGKTTLLNIIAGVEPMDAGKITTKRDLRVSYLKQLPDFSPEITVLETFSEFANEQKAKQILTKFNITRFDQPMGTLSGGQVKRVALANVLIQEPDLLILDEPTNHLDLEMTEYLENYLNRSNVTLLMVTHDRYFLDRVCNEIIEIDNKRFYRYKGNYSYYLEKRQERIDQTNAELARANNLFRKELDWMRRQPQARATKAKSRIEDFYKLQEKVSQKVDNGKVRIENKSTYIGSKIFEAKYISKSFGDLKILDNFYYQFSRYEKMGIIGANGTGKSTFIKLLLGVEKPDAGSFDIGETVRFGYYSQEGLKFNDQMKVIDAVREIAEEVDLGGGRKLSASQFLQHFLFAPETQHNYIYKLSGGEKRRLYLCTVLMRNPNFLVLDEPTNDLDIVTLNILEDYLINFKGCVIVVSHDRYFMDKVVDHLLVFKGNAEIKDFPGNYTDYRDWRNEQEAMARKVAASDNTTKTQNNKPRNEAKKKLSFAEKRELEALEVEIAQLEEEKKALEEGFASGTLDMETLQKNAKRMEELIPLLDEKSMRWLTLSDI